jgi:hypothetical protein
MTAAAPAVRKGAILIVECAEIRRFLRFLLTRAGLSVLDAEPECGGRMLAEHVEDVALIITNRPQQFVASGIPIIYIAAIPEAQMREQCAQVLPKPFRPADLLFHIDRLGMLGRQTFSQSASRTTA